MQADQIDCLKPLEILDFGLALASRQPAPEFNIKNAAMRRFLCNIRLFSATIFHRGGRTCQ